MGFLFDILTMSIQLIAIIDPIGALPILMSMPELYRPEIFRRISRLVAMAVPSLLILFAIAGPYILRVFKVDLTHFRIAGGIILLVIGIDTLREGVPRTMSLSPEDFIFVPIITPMLVGPGAITTVMLFRTYHALPEVVVSILIASLVTYLVIRFSTFIVKAIGTNMARFLGRFMSLIITAWAVSLIIEGVKEAIGWT